MTDQRQNPEIESARLRSKAEAADAAWAGVGTALVGTIAILVVGILADQARNQRMAGALLILTGCGCVFLLIGLLSGWLAHKGFSGTDFRPSMVAVILSAIAMLSILGWGFVMSLKA